ncbi:MAG: hypothetical protein HONDAALG_03588 [Gammaproteobacteria bacterium]|nr:hypothetical protein [Gammaproteobacteria bacterium]
MWRVGFLLWFAPLRGGPLFRLRQKAVFSFGVSRHQVFFWFFPLVSFGSRVTGFSWALAGYDRLARPWFFKGAFDLGELW